MGICCIFICSGFQRFRERSLAFIYEIARYCHSVKFITQFLSTSQFIYTIKFFKFFLTVWPDYFSHPIFSFGRLDVESNFTTVSLGTSSCCRILDSEDIEGVEFIKVDGVSGRGQ